MIHLYHHVGAKSFLAFIIAHQQILAFFKQQLGMFSSCVQHVVSCSLMLGSRIFDGRGIPITDCLVETLLHIFNILYWDNIGVFNRLSSATRLVVHLVVSEWGWHQSRNDCQCWYFSDSLLFLQHLDAYCLPNTQWWCDFPQRTHTIWVVYQRWCLTCATPW